MTALVLGATGLTGSSLLQIILEDPYFDQVKVCTRRALDRQHPKLVTLITDFSDLEAYALEADIVFSCLGTTRKQTPDLEQYRKLEIDIPVEVARRAGKSGLRQFHYISAMGANADSRNFYLKIKGIAEQQISQQPIASVHIYRPALITGSRKEKRGLEKIAAGIFKAINPLLTGNLKKYRSIEAMTIAKAMVANSKQTKPGIFIYPSDQIQALSGT